jgi:formate hydrogenlyase subunit 3/multisubunit Na+/H+ antiporter MnhD subunit
MPIQFLLVYIVMVVGFGALSLCIANRTVQKELAGAISLASLMLLVYCIVGFHWIEGDGVTTLMKWQMPFASLTVGIDSLSLFFLIPLLILTVSGALYGPHYFGPHEYPRSHWFFFSLLIAGMAMSL